MEDISKLDPIPERFNVGVAVIGSEKVAVMVTTSELATISSASVSDRMTEGVVLSAINVFENSKFKFPAISSNEFSFNVSVTIPE